MEKKILKSWHQTIQNMKRKKKVVIVGGVAGGMSAATRLRRLNEEMEIIVFEKGPYVSFANCGMPYVISGEIEKEEDLLLRTPQMLWDQLQIKTNVNSEVLEIHVEDKKISVKKDGTIFQEDYDALILSTGALPNIPEIEGLAKSKRCFVLRNMVDLEHINGFLLKEKPQHAVVIGGGFIGLEVVENLVKKGIQVALVEKAPHILTPFDEEMTQIIAHELKEQGVSLYTNNSVMKIMDDQCILADGTKLKSDFILLSIGVHPDTSLARQAGIKLGIKEGILVDEHYQTSQPNIYAVGDAIVVKQQITGKDTLISLASLANRHGRQVADVLSGVARKNKGSIGTAIVRVFHKTAAFVGLNERTLRKEKMDYRAIHLSANQHAGYYPGAKKIHMKLLFHPKEGTIYGAQIIGEDGVDKRIDVISTAIKGHLKVQDLIELELAYAPPFGSSKDPVNMIGYVALNIVEGLSDNIQWHEVEDAKKKGSILLDVREINEIENDKRKNYQVIPLKELNKHLSELDGSSDYIVSGKNGYDTYLAERILKKAGYNVKSLDGGFLFYETPEF